MLWVEHLVAVHDGDEVFGFREIDNVMGIAWEHVDSLDVVATHFEVEDFVTADAAHLNEAMTFDDNKLFPFRMMPMLPFGNAWLTDVDADLTGMCGVDEFCEGTSCIDIHFQWEGYLIFGKVAKVGGI